ncbi:MAG: DUF664 domain-containing protein [Flavobacteriaceae bacterium]
MNFLKKNIALLIMYFSFSILNAQYEIIPEEGYTAQIGIMVDMLEDIKDRITANINDLSQEQTDFLFDEQANSIGSMIMHLAATEAYYQVETIEGRRWTAEEASLWSVAGGLGDKSRAEYKAKPIDYYLDLWEEVRKKTLEGLKTKDDNWFSTSNEEGINNHWVWFHVLEHQAAHMGQIDLVKARLPK